MSTATTNSRAEKFRDMAERLQREIDGKRGDRRENTPKQQREATAARIEANHLERTQKALNVMADTLEAGTFPFFLEAVKSKAQVLDMLRTRTVSHGYYHIGDSGEFSDQSPLAVAFRMWLESVTDSPEARAAKAERARLDRIKELEQTVKFSNIPGFFPTPPDVIKLMLAAADLEPGIRILEPSAGKGDIVDAIVATVPRSEIFLDVLEINHTLTQILGQKGHHVNRFDFLEWKGTTYDVILMNPPFENGQDIDHVRHAFSLLKESGSRIVAIMSSGPFYRSDRKATEFRDWLNTVWHEVTDLGPDAFKDSFRSTGVSTKLVVIDK